LDEDADISYRKFAGTGASPYSADESKLPTSSEFFNLLDGIPRITPHKFGDLSKGEIEVRATIFNNGYGHAPAEADAFQTRALHFVPKPGQVATYTDRVHIEFLASNPVVGPCVSFDPSRFSAVYYLGGPAADVNGPDFSMALTYHVVDLPREKMSFVLDKNSLNEPMAETYVNLDSAAWKGTTHFYELFGRVAPNATETISPTTVTYAWTRKARVLRSALENVRHILGLEIPETLKYPGSWLARSYGDTRPAVTFDNVKKELAELVRRVELTKQNVSV
jgi:hypothetical protein